MYLALFGKFVMNTKFITVIVIVAAFLGSILFVASVADPTADAASNLTTAVSVATTTTDPGPTEAEINFLNETIWNQTVWVNKTNEAAWIEATEIKQAAAAVAQAKVEAEAAAKAAAARVQAKAKEQATAVTSQPSSSSANPAPSQGSGRCGGDLPPCYVMQRESGGSLTAQNPSSTASGKWQFLNSTWAGFGGYSEAWQAPESVQDAKARALWAGGAGCSHWSAC